MNGSCNFKDGRNMSCLACPQTVHTYYILVLTDIDLEPIRGRLLGVDRENISVC